MSEKKPFYPVFTNKKNNKLVFYPVKKNANSSAKLFFAKHLGIEDKFYFLEDEKPRYLLSRRDYKKYSQKHNLMQFFVNNSKFERVNIEIKACIIRNPVERFLSAYKNRILYHKDKEFYNHSIDIILDKLEKNLFENRHFLPQTFFLGNDLSYYTFWSDVNNLELFEEKVNNFFGKKIKFPKIQTGGHELKVKLNYLQLERVKKIYQSDYHLISQ